MKVLGSVASAISLGMFGGIVAANPHPAFIGLFIVTCAMALEAATLRVLEALPKTEGQTITITRDQLDEHPDIIADHLRLTTKLRDYIEEQERTARAQNRMADDLDNGVYDETFGKVDPEKMPPQAYRAAARANQWTATFLRRALNPEREETT